MAQQSIQDYFTNLKISKAHIFLLITTSLLLYLASGFFSVKNFLTSPQFTEIIPEGWFIKNADIYDIILYHAFFIIDFIWAPTLLLFLYKYVKKNTTYKWVPYLFIGISILALVFDYIENITYLTKYSHPKAISSYKTYAYSILFLIAIIAAIFGMDRSRILLVRDFLKSSWISLLFLFVFGLTLPGVPQFNSIVVDLYYKNSQFSFILFGVFIPLYVVVLSHYPNYFLLASKNRKIAEKDWRMSNRWWLFGTIWFINKNSSPEKRAYEAQIGLLRKTLGILFFSAIFYLLADTADTNFEIKFKFAKLTFPFMIGMIYLLYFHYKTYAKWRIANNPYLKKELLNTSEKQSKSKIPTILPDPSLLHISRYSKIYAIWLSLSIITIILLFISLQIDKNCPYTLKNVIISLIAVITQAITYIYYRIYRSSFKYTFFNKNHKHILKGFNLLLNTSNLTPEEIEKRRQTVFCFFKKHDFKVGKFGWILSFFSKLRVGIFSIGAFSSSLIFLKKFIFLGFINAFFLLLLNFYNEKAIHINSVIIILSYFLLFYGGVVVLLKHNIYYYNSTEKFIKKTQLKYFKLMTGTALALLLLNYMARFNEPTKNNLYKLNLLEHKKNSAISIQEYAKNLDSKSNRFYVGCYGGGMKANAWTMTVLEKLQNDYNFMTKATCISGASGGTIGMINFATIFNNKSTKRKEAIKKIATENVLGIDLVHFFGRDFFTHLFTPHLFSPLLDLRGRDRSTAAMKKYARYAGYTHANYNNRLFDTLPYREYWKEMYLKNNKKFPILIVNTTNIRGKQGMAVSVRSKGLSKQALYFGADDVVEIDSLHVSKTLSYYNAASTSNRFPVLSPAATIEGKGQYSDGGIFDNSGLLSALKAQIAIEVTERELNKSIDSTNSRKDVFVNIVNSKDLFIKNYLSSFFQKNKTNCFSSKINEVTEIPAILNSISSTEMVPDHTKNRIQFLAKTDNFISKNKQFISIYLPHTFDLNDVKRLYKPEITNINCVDELTYLIELNNLEIRKLIAEKVTNKKYIPVIEPELSRVIAKPAFLFMQQMLKHSSVITSLKKLTPLLKN